MATAVDLGGGVRVEAVHLGRGHTDGDLVVVVPGSDVVFAGDLVESSGPPSYGPDSYAHEWPATLDGLIGLTTDTHRGRCPATADRWTARRSSSSAVGSPRSPGRSARLAGLAVRLEDAEERGTWALPFAAVRDGLEAAFARRAPRTRSAGYRSPDRAR